MFRDYTEPWDYEDSAAFMARQDYEKSMIEDMAEKSLEMSVQKAEEADDNR